mgnify:CR=1 FL=1|tara:strand:+ start:3567 stop:5465 length:1899 start_codon:yes stop_codon:yes gene_type:complete
MDLNTATKLLKYSPSDVQRVRYVVEYANHNTDNPSEYIDLHTSGSAQKEIAKIFVETANAATLNMKSSDASPKIDTVKEKESTVDPCCDNQRTIKAKPSEASAKTEEVEHIQEQKPGLYANIHAKRKRIAAGSGEKKAKPGSDDYPEKGAFKKAAKTAKEEVEHLDELSKKTLGGYVAKASKEVQGHMNFKNPSPEIKKVKDKQIKKRVSGMASAGRKMAEAYAAVYEQKYDNRYSDNTGEESRKKKEALEKKRGMKLDNHPQFKREEVEHVEEQKSASKAKKYLDDKAKKLQKEYDKQSDFEKSNPAFQSRRLNPQPRYEGVLHRVKEIVKEFKNYDAPPDEKGNIPKGSTGSGKYSMSKKDYDKTHKDFKSDDPKNPRISHLPDPKKGTKSSPVKFVEHHQKDKDGKVIEHEDVTPVSVEEGLKQARKNVGASKCWDGKKIGSPPTKTKNGKEVPNCVPEEIIKSTKFVISETPKGDMGKDRATKVKDRSARSYGGSGTYGAKYNAPIRRGIHDDNRGVKKDKGHVNRVHGKYSKFNDDRQGGSHWYNQGQGLAGTKKHGKSDYDEPSRKKVKKENYSWRESMNFDEQMIVTNADKKGNTKAYQNYKAGMKNPKTGKPVYKPADHLKDDK